MARIATAVFFGWFRHHRRLIVSEVGNMRVDHAENWTDALQVPEFTRSREFLPSGDGGVAWDLLPSRTGNALPRFIGDPPLMAWTRAREVVGKVRSDGPRVRQARPFNGWVGSRNFRANGGPAHGWSSRHAISCRPRRKPISPAGKPPKRSSPNEEWISFGVFPRDSWTCRIRSRPALFARENGGHKPWVGRDLGSAERVDLNGAGG